MPKYDIVLLTGLKYAGNSSPDPYVDNVILEDRLLMEALSAKGLKVCKMYWDNEDFDWTSTHYAMIRTTWDIYEDGKFQQFQDWLKKTNTETQLINDYSTILWNVDKHYLQDLEKRNINIPATIFIQKGETKSLQEIVSSSQWENPILKPAISGGGRHTYKLSNDSLDEIAETFAGLIQNEAMLLQEFQHSIVDKGELTVMVFGGKYSHAVLKKAKTGDFRVQDDFGGTVHEYQPSAKEIEFAEKVVSVCEPTPVQARVDFIWDNEGELCVSELELIEPELWFRNKEGAADQLAEVIVNKYF